LTNYSNEINGPSSGVAEIKGNRKKNQQVTGADPKIRVEQFKRSL
jgi:hypothetical protein